MSSHEILYSHNSGLIAVVLFLLILLANELGYRFGGRGGAKANEALKSQTSAIQAAVLGLLALLLGFTFTMALQRYDGRTHAVVEEANAIGTAYLRSQLLPEADRARTAELIRRYVDLRVEAGRVDLTRVATWQELLEETAEVQQELWSHAVEAVEKDPRQATGLFVQSMNEVFDSQGRRYGALEKHVPEVVLLLLFTVFIMGGAVLGYGCGLGGGRPLLATVLMSGLIVLVVFIIVDLDRPRRGLIQVNQERLLDLRSAMHREP